MKVFSYQVKDKFMPIVLNGEVEASNMASAYQEILDIYTVELGTDEHGLDIIIEEVI